MSKLIDLTGKKFNRLTVLRKDTERKTNNGSYWICQCDCGKIKSVKSSSLRRGEVQSCGCLRNEKVYEKMQELDYIDHLEGQRFGKLTVLSKDHEETKKHNNAVYWKCQCDCGKIKSIRGNNLKRKDENRTVSCGCYHRSVGETNILILLSENNINFIDQYRFVDFNKMPYDFAIIENNKIIRLIEFDGEQHFKETSGNWEPLEKIQERDSVKNQYAKEHNIPLVRIPYWERDNITLEMLLGNQYLI